MSARTATSATLSLVVPTYNERDRLPELVRAIFAAYDAAAIDFKGRTVAERKMAWKEALGQVRDLDACRWSRHPLRPGHRVERRG